MMQWPTPLRRGRCQSPRRDAIRRAPGVFQELLRPGGVADELRSKLVPGRLEWGSLALFRSQGASRFTESERDTVAGLVHRLVTGARKAWAVSVPMFPERDLTEPGTLLMSSDGALVSETAAARRLLAQVPGAYSILMAVVARLGTTMAASLRTRTTTGEWLRVSGSRLVPPAGGASIAITVQPATAAEIAPLLLHAFGMTRRQRAVARLVVAGRSTDQIAAILSLSPYTVNDHLKAIAIKAGVHSRGELVARLSGLPV